MHEIHTLVQFCIISNRIILSISKNGFAVLNFKQAIIYFTKKQQKSIHSKCNKTNYMTHLQCVKTTQLLNLPEVELLGLAFFSDNTLMGIIIPMNKNRYI